MGVRKEKNVFLYVNVCLSLLVSVSVAVLVVVVVVVLVAAVVLASDAVDLQIEATSVRKISTEVRRAWEKHYVLVSEIEPKCLHKTLY